MSKEVFFTVFATEEEHGFVESFLQEFCNKENVELKYYRKFKTGHVPMYRETKLIFPDSFQMNKFTDFCKENCIDPTENYHRKIKSHV